MRLKVVFVWAFFIASVWANTEIRNFGPTLCSRTANAAIQKLSLQWYVVIARFNIGLSLIHI